MRRAFFVLGPEGSGTHMLTEAFRLAGCHEESVYGGFPEDGIYDFWAMPDLFVFRRSLPHAHRWPPIWSIFRQLEDANYEVQPILIIRDWYCTIQSVMRRDYVRQFDQCEQNMRNAIERVSGIFTNLIYVTYESFCMHREFRQWLFCERLGLPEPEIQIYYGNTKYYENGMDYINENSSLHNG